MNAAGAIALTGSDQTVLANAGTYMGFSIRETTGSTSATVRVYNNASAASGTLIDSIQLAAGESAREWYGPLGIYVTAGIFVKIVSGTIEGSARIA